METSTNRKAAAYFLKYAESTGLVILLDQYIIENSLKKIEELHKKGFDDVYIATNISLRHFQRKDFVEKICLILERGGKSSEHLMLQIAGELDIGKIETYKVMFDKIKQYGVKLSINNYCVNYEQLDLLNRLNIDEIKISSEYLVSNSIFNKNVLKDIVILSKDLGYKILVNKISDDDIFKEVVKYPVNCIQGNYIYPTISENQVEDFLKDFNKKSSNNSDSKKVSKKNDKLGKMC